MKKLGIFMLAAMVAISFIAGPICDAEAQTSEQVLVAKSDKASKSSNSKGNSDKKSNNNKSDNANKSKSGAENSKDKSSNNKQKDNQIAKEQKNNGNKGIDNQDKNNQANKVKNIKNISSENKEKLQKKIKERKENNNTKELSDVKAHWAEKHISKSQKLGLISGYQDGTFKPEHTITMAEAMVMSVRLAELLDVDNAQPETDITDEVTEEQSEQQEQQDETTDIPDWAKDSAKKAFDKKIINLNRFHSEVQASRAQTAVMLAKAMNLEPVDTTDATFSDGILISTEDVGYILALKEAGIVKGTADGKFNPNSAVTRAEFAAMLDRIIGQVDEEEPVEEEPVEETPAEDEQNTTEEGDKVVVDDQDNANDEQTTDEVIEQEQQDTETTEEDNTNN